MTPGSFFPLPLMFLLAVGHSFSSSFFQSRRYSLSSSSLTGTNKWDLLIDEDEDGSLQFDGPPVPRDMKYNMFNINRQRENFESIKSVAGKDLTNDVYARDPDTSTFWYVGKIARVSDVSLEKAMARQYPMIEEHSARLRPAELYPKWGNLELWTAPGDSELDVAYCKPEIRFVQMYRDVSDASDVRNVEIGWAGELYENNEEGFRTTRTDDGRAAKPEMESSVDQRQPTELEMDEMMEMLNSQVVSSSDDE